MIREAILHHPYGSYAYPVGEERLRVILRLSARDDCQCVIYYDDRYKSSFPSYRAEMERIIKDQLFAYYEAFLDLSSRRFRYCFSITCKEEALWCTEEGLFESRPEKYLEGLFQYPYLCFQEEERTPSWAQEAVIYQIFPDRFSNGDPSLSPKIQASWGSRPKRDSFYGGDLKGIIGRLSYLEELGINALYLTPLFASPSNHRYDTQDYYKIDPMLGDEATFAQLIKEAHNRGIRVILDGVFNHTSHLFPPFIDVQEKGEESRYRDWFIVNTFPIRQRPKASYETFGRNISSMPRLNTYNREVMEHFLEVGKYWAKKGIDGWRFDVANEVNPEFWRLFRQEMQKIRKDLFLTGEIWHRGEPWVEADMFHSLMNYPFREAVLDCFAYDRLSSKGLENRLATLQTLYREEVSLCLWNLLGSHDTPRIDRVFQKDRETLKLALLLQFTYPGIPHILYGDEIGLTGGDDPDCRRCMIWDKKRQDLDLLGYYKRLIQLRKENHILKRGSFRSLDVGELFGFSRRVGDEEIIVVINNQRRDVELCLKQEGSYKDLLSGEVWSSKEPMILAGKRGWVLKRA